MSVLTDLQAIQKLYEAARQMVKANRADPDLIQAVMTVDSLVAQSNTEFARMAITDANVLYAGIVNNECDLDLDRIAYDNEVDGWWVMAWLHVPYREEKGHDTKPDVSHVHLLDMDPG